MNNPTMLALLATSTLGPFLPAQAAAVKPAPPIDLAICLDTSGSMRGLIDAARHNIWAIVNDLALAQPTPKLRIALLTFGNSHHAEKDGWVKIETDLTDDLDLVSQRLFALTTGGGTEYVGRVLDTATRRLGWREDPRALKIILVAGNESADQDRAVPFQGACKRAVERDITINSFYCGDPNDTIAPGWRQVAKLADGHHASIHHNAATVVIPTPFDDKLTELSAALNETYVAYGTQGRRGKKNQVAQDSNASCLSPQAAAQRAVAKSTSNYVCAWDLATNYRNGKVKLDDLKDEDLPPNMRQMSARERRAHLETLLRTRASLQKQIGQVHREREKWLVQERAKRSQAPNTFESAVRRAVRAQAEARGFRYAG